MTNHFCVIVLFEYPCNVDHESDAKIKMIKIRARLHKSLKVGQELG